MVRYLATSLIAACGLFGMAEQAGAVAIGPMLAGEQPATVGRMSAALRSLQAPNCSALMSASAEPARLAGAGGVQPVPPSAPQAVPAQFSKAAAILGGAASALDRIRMDQAAQASAAMPASLTMAGPAAGSVPGVGLSPGAAPLAMPLPAVAGVDCGRFALPKAAIAAAPGRVPRLPGSEDFLQTKRLAVSRTAFDRQWERVSRQGLSPRFVDGDAVLSRAARGGATMAAVETVNAWANRRIRFADDAKLFGTADYWATAQATLTRGAGDCEDIAIAKMQLLAAMGVARSDMYLTIARDLARHADHALLVVRMDGRYWLLDNSTDRVLDADASYDYQPVLSFSQGRKWLHGAVLARAD